MEPVDGDAAAATAAAAANDEQQTNKKTPARHPILDRLENNDYDFNGQSLDYEPNLEFDDTDLKQEIEDELEQLNENILRKLNFNERNLSDSPQSTATASSSTPNEPNLNGNSSTIINNQNASELLSADETLHSTGGDCNVDQLALELFDEADNVFLRHLQSQMQCEQPQVAYLESPHDLLEENFEEAFKSSLFELQNAAQNEQQQQQQRKRQQKQANKNKQTLNTANNYNSNSNSRLFNKLNSSTSTSSSATKTTSTNKLSNFPFFKQLIHHQQQQNQQQQHEHQQQQQQHTKTSCFYVNKENLLNDKIKHSQSADGGKQDNQTTALTLNYNNHDNHNKREGEEEEDDDDDDDLDDEELMSSLYSYDSNDDFQDIAQYNCVEVAGDDLFGRRIITIYACRLPSAFKIHHLRLLKYIMYTLDQYVENDYCLVYFHFGLNSQNKPKLNFLYQAYRAFDRKYKKNLKALFLVHPTNFIRIVWQLFRPIIR